jgi:hypothetical protein
MGGTSTDVFHVAAGSPGEVFIPERRQRAEVAGFALLAPMVAIHTVAAGGGSLIHFDGGRLRVGPASAGADPGPAAYRRGGPATLTDANVVLGRLQPAFFPQVFGPRRDKPLDTQASRDVLAALAQRLEAASGLRHSPEQVAVGAIAIATARMAEAIKRVSVQKGHAIDHAELVAENIMGAARDYVPAPWFWSDQYDTKLQIAGLNTGYDQIVTRGPDGDAVSFWYLKAGALIAVDAMNDSRAYMVGKRLLETDRGVDAGAISNPATNLKSLLS